MARDAQAQLVAAMHAETSKRDQLEATIVALTETVELSNMDKVGGTCRRAVACDSRLPSVLTD